MLKWLMKRKLRALGDPFGDDTSYGAELIDADLRGIILGDVARMSAEASLGQRFAKALLMRSAEFEALLDEIAGRWGAKALAASSINTVASRTFPALKYALGHGQSCQSGEIGGDMIAPNELAYA